MYKKVSTAKELGNAIRNGESRITVTGSLGNAVLRVEAIGPIAWGVLIAAVGVSVFSVSATVATGGVAAPAATVSHQVAVPTAVAAASGVDIAVALGTIAATSGGIGTLHALRTYKARREGNYVVLTKRW